MTMPNLAIPDGDPNVQDRPELCQYPFHIPSVNTSHHKLASDTWQIILGHVDNNLSLSKRDLDDLENYASLFAERPVVIITDVDGKTRLSHFSSAIAAQLWFDHDDVSLLQQYVVEDPDPVQRRMAYHPLRRRGPLQSVLEWNEADKTWRLLVDCQGRLNLKDWRPEWHETQSLAWNQDEVDKCTRHDSPLDSAPSSPCLSSVSDAPIDLHIPILDLTDPPTRPHDSWRTDPRHRRTSSLSSDEHWSNLDTRTLSTTDYLGLVHPICTFRFLTDYFAIVDTNNEEEQDEQTRELIRDFRYRETLRETSFACIAAVPCFFEQVLVADLGRDYAGPEPAFCNLFTFRDEDGMIRGSERGLEGVDPLDTSFIISTTGS